jgi:HlyD family secretion protein
MIRIIRSLVLPALAMAALGFASCQVLRGQGKTEPVLPTAPPAVTPFTTCVAGSGIAEPRTENISVGALVGGVVAEVAIKHNQHVEAGQLLFRIDDRQLKCTLAVRQAALASARAELSKLENMPRKEEVIPAVAKVAEAEANVKAQADLRDRAEKLLDSNAISREEFVTRDMAWQAVKQQLARLKAELALLNAGAWEPDKAIARAAVARAEAEVKQAQVDIDRLEVRAPVSGEVLQVNVRPSEYINTPHSMAPIVLGNLETLHIRVDIDEHDIPRFIPGSPARASVRGNPQKSYPLTFVRVDPYVVPKKSLTGDSSERVDTRVLQVIYALQPGEKSVYVGQQLDVFIDVSSKAL